MVKVFLAGSMRRKTQINYMAKELSKWGIVSPCSVGTQLNPIEIVSTWHNNPMDYGRRRLTLNLVELQKANRLVIDLFAPSTSGGYHAEFGYFTNKISKVYLVGQAPKKGYLTLVKHWFPLYRDLRNFWEHPENF